MTSGIVANVKAQATRVFDTLDDGDATWELDPDRLLPLDEQTRAIARDLYAAVETMPIISPHGHVNPTLLTENIPFTDPAALFITDDHYVTRLLHAAGNPLAELGVGGAAADPRTVWRRFCEHWHVFAGTASGAWLRHELIELFGIGVEPSASTADRIFDTIEGRLTSPEMLPRELFERFRIEVLATTDDPLDDLTHHDALAQDTCFSGRVLPTFRPDAYIDPRVAGFHENVQRLAEHFDAPLDDYHRYLSGLASRREYFISRGAISADHGVLEPFATELDDDAAAALYSQAVRGALAPQEARLFAGHMLFQMAKMSVRDGLVMTVHPGVSRNHHAPTFRAHGPDTGHDIPVRTEFTNNLRELLGAFGTAPGFHLVLFAVDETTFSREIAPLAGFYPSVFIGAPWWFLDAPDAIRRFRSATTETAGFYRGAGFIDDTRAFLSIPARHDTARRLDAGFLAQYVREGRLGAVEAERIAVDLVDSIPRKAFKL